MQPSSPGFPAVPTGSCASRTPFIPERPAIPERSSPRTPGAAPPASASQWAPNYWAAHSLPAFQDPLLFSAQHQRTHPKSLLNWGFRLFFLRGRPACSEPGHTPGAERPRTHGELPWDGFHLRKVAEFPSGYVADIEHQVDKLHSISTPFPSSPRQLFFTGVKSELL